MNEIKRRLMNGYVEMEDGTFAKEVNGELIPVHEDEANAFEPEMFLDEDMAFDEMDEDMDFDVMDEDMAYWYESDCPVDDCPGFRG